MSLNRFFMKTATVYVVYDRLTGKIVGDSFAADVKRIMPQGVSYDERIESSAAKIPLGQEQAFHDIVKKLRYKPTS